jgi:membrane protein
MSKDNISLLAAGVAFYSLLAIFPGFAFIVAMFGLLADPDVVQQQLMHIRALMPEQAWDALNAQLLVLTRQTSATLSLASAISLLLALINARLAVYAMMSALNTVYGLDETRSFVKINAIALLFTAAAFVDLIISIFAVIAVPLLLKFLGLAEFSHSIINTLRWPVLAALTALSLALLYRFGADRKDGDWRWIILGCLVAAGLWLLGSTAFSWYVASFGSYDKLYGSFGAVVILLYWFWLTAFVALAGAELDMQIETATERNKRPVASAQKP